MKKNLVANARNTRHCEVRSNEAIQKNQLDCFTLQVRNDDHVHCTNTIQK